MAGEFLPAELVDRVYNAGVKQVFDLYGPTETTTYSTGVLRVAGAAPTIGTPIANTRVYLLDDQFMQTPPGSTGEIFIGGEGVTRGYLHRPDLTAERFLTLPAIEQDGRLYRTGDLARYTSDGLLIYQGRRDNQIKLRGHRIELGEIEEALREMTGASQVAVVMQHHEAGDSLAAFIASAVSVEISECLVSLRQRLPAYMIPSQIIQIERMPLTPNGKVDRNALSASEKAAKDHDAAMPQDLLEQWLANIWCDRLGKKKITRDAHFFDDLGGHSLVAFEIFAQIEKRLGVAMMLGTLFQSFTVELLATAVRRLRWNVPKSISFCSSGTSEVVIYCIGLKSNVKALDVRDTFKQSQPEARLMKIDDASANDVEGILREIIAFEAARPSLVLLAHSEMKDKAEKLAAGLFSAGFRSVSISDLFQ